MTAFERTCYIRKSRPDSGIGFRVKVLEILQGVTYSVGSGWEKGEGFSGSNIQRIR